jgi:hypothetical protein
MSLAGLLFSETLVACKAEEEFQDAPTFGSLEQKENDKKFKPKEKF